MNNTQIDEGLITGLSWGIVFILAGISYTVMYHFFKWFIEKSKNQDFYSNSNNCGYVICGLFAYVSISNVPILIIIFTLGTTDFFETSIMFGATVLIAILFIFFYGLIRCYDKYQQKDMFGNVI